MNQYSLSDHTHTCWGSRVNKYIFQYDFNFYCINYCRCWEGYDHLDWKLLLLKSIGKKLGKTDWRLNQSISKSNPLKKALKERDSQIILQSGFFEIMGIYYDNAGKEYCFGNSMDYKEYVSKCIGYHERFHEALKWAKDDEISFKQLSNLHYANKDHVESLSQNQMITLTDLLTKKFIKNDYASKQ